ncbi:hypothetical protein ACFV3O_27620, partial [Streptomyces albidoflavus]
TPPFRQGHDTGKTTQTLSISLMSDDATLDARREALGGRYEPVARERKVSAALRAYAAMATSADKGAVRDVTKLG